MVEHTIDNFRDSRSCASIMPERTLIHANVATSNLSALRFYESMGMAVSSDVIRNLYRTPISYGSKDAYLVAGVL